LVGGARDLPARQQTLRSTIAWSYDLLSEWEQRLSQRLAVFVDGCTLDAAEAVCSDCGWRIGDRPGPNPPSAIRNEEVLDGLTSLIDQSLLQREAGVAGEPRFRMLETIREFAVECLAASGEGGEIRRQHAVFFLELAERGERELRGGQQREWLERLQLDHGNLRAALEWSEAEEGSAETQARIAGAMSPFWYIRSHHGSEGRRWLAGVLSRSQQLSPSMQAKALVGAGRLAWGQSDWTVARSFMEKGLALARKSGNKREVAYALLSRGLLAQAQSDYSTARSSQEEGRALYRELGDRWGTAWSQFLAGWTAWSQRDYATARRHLEASLALQQEVGDRECTAWTLHHLGSVAFEQGEWEAAQSLWLECRVAFQEMGKGPGLAYTLIDLGELAWLNGETTTARAHFEQGLAVARDVGDKRPTAMALHGLGLLAHQRGEAGEARLLLEESLIMLQEVGDRWLIARSLSGLAVVAEAEQQPERAARLAGAAEAQRQVLGAQRSPVERVHFDGGVATGRSAIDKAVVATAWAEGRVLSMEQAIAYALTETEATRFQ
jgi:tetratricopeptide (TPR) repeat protein